MAIHAPIRLETALDLEIPNSSETLVQFPKDIVFFDVAYGGYTTSVLQKLAVLHASQHPRMRHQCDIRSSTTTFLRPIFPKSGPCHIKFHELNINSTSSIIRVEAFQGGKMAGFVDCILTNFSAPGLTLHTNWQISPPPTPIDLRGLENDLPSATKEWMCYHRAFTLDEPRKVQTYVKYYVHTKWVPGESSNEVWVQPGWDCFPQGSRDPSMPEARWTTEMIPFIMDIFLPILKNLFITPEEPRGIISTPWYLHQAEAQRRAREDEKRPDWRVLDHDIDHPLGPIDSSENAIPQVIHANITQTMMIETKRKLPPEGVRWIYLRGESRGLENGRMDFHTLAFDEHMNMIAVKNGIEVLRSSKTRIHKGTPKDKTKSGSRL